MSGAPTTNGVPESTAVSNLKTLLIPHFANPMAWCMVHVQQGHCCYCNSFR